MAYTPIADADTNPPVKGNATAWTTAVTNDAEVFEAYAPGLECQPVRSNLQAAREFRLRWRGNLDAEQLNVGVYAEGVNGPHTVSVETLAQDSGTLSAGAEQWYTDTLDATGPVQEIVISSAALGVGETLAYSGIRVSLSPAALGATRYKSGFRRVGSTLWTTADSSVASEIVERLKANALRLAVDRPVCVFVHCSDTVQAVSTKTPGLWGVQNETTHQVIGRGMVPFCDGEDREYLVDAYATDDDPGTASFSVTVGGRAQTWTGSGWRTWTVRLPPGDHPIVATCAPGGSNAGAIRTLQVWRMKGARDGFNQASDPVAVENRRRYEG